MTDARYPERWLNDRRLVRLSDGAHRLFVTSLAWSVANRTDGKITADDLPLLSPGTHPPDPRDIGRLVESRLWEFRGDCWLITDFAETQTTAADLDKLARGRRAQRDKKRRQRARAAPIVPGDVPGDTPRPGQDRPGQAPRPGSGADAPAPPHSLREHDGPETVADEAQHIPAAVHRRSPAADRNPRARHDGRSAS